MYDLSATALYKYCGYLFTNRLYVNRTFLW